jgi:hypothetical protein
MVSPRDTALDDEFAMNVVAHSPDFTLDRPLHLYLARRLGTSLYRFAGRVASVRVKLSAVPGDGEAPRTRCVIQVSLASFTRPKVVVACRGRDVTTAVSAAVRRMERSLAAALLPA